VDNRHSWLAANQMSVAAGSANNILVALGATLAIYTDILSAGSAPPTLLGPADEYEVTAANAIVVSVQNIPGVLQWQILLSNDQTFTNNVSGTTFQIPPATEVIVNLGGLGLSTEKPIYWLARSATGQPLKGPSSEIRVVYPQPTAGVNAPATISPAGTTAVNVPINAVFNWGILKYASGYHLQVASDPNFTALIIDANVGNVTSYYLAEPLDYDSAYFWRIRGLTATGGTDWSAGVGFSTEAAPAAVEPPVTVTTQPAPTVTIEQTQITPSWIIAIIVVGAVLVVSVIVLIIRTRRVP
jgi:hypothetical protein